MRLLVLVWAGLGFLPALLSAAPAVLRSWTCDCPAKGTLKKGSPAGCVVDGPSNAPDDYLRFACEKPVSACACLKYDKPDAEAPHSHCWHAEPVPSSYSTACTCYDVECPQYYCKQKSKRRGTYSEQKAVPATEIYECECLGELNYGSCDCHTPPPPNPYSYAHCCWCGAETCSEGTPDGGVREHGASVCKGTAGVRP